MAQMYKFSIIVSKFNNLNRLRCRTMILGAHLDKQSRYCIVRTFLVQVSWLENPQKKCSRL